MSHDDSLNSPLWSAVAGIVLDDAQRMLMIRRSATVRAPNMFCFPGGGIEPGESDRDAVVREFQEELGLIVDPLDCIWESRTMSGGGLFWWTAHVEDITKITPNPAEVADWGWYSREVAEQLDPLLSTNVEFFAALRKGVFRL
jgi:8-oxo-dGTP diphosphatase